MLSDQWLHGRPGRNRNQGHLCFVRVLITFWQTVHLPKAATSRSSTCV